MGKQVIHMDRDELTEECRARGINAEETASRNELLLRVQTYDEGMRAANLPPPGYKRAEPDREIIYELDGLRVSNRDPNYEYCWVYYGLNSQLVWQKRYLGWRVVTGTDPECQEYKEVDGTRRIGDVLLMRIPKERYLELEEREAKKRDDQYLGIKARLQELSEKSGIKVHEDLSQVSVGGRSLESIMEHKAAAQEVAIQHIDKKLRDGDVPGIPSPKKD